MTVWAVDGAAGYGKTYRLMQMLEQVLTERPLQERQRVLALTYMHGSRRRLDARLRSVPGLHGHFECITVDSLAWRLRQRWRSLSETLGLPPPLAAAPTFEVECERAAVLLSQATVQRWMAASFPIVVVDEAQDLTVPRLSMVASLSTARILLAADEFQCLEASLRPNPLAQWLPTVCSPATLAKPQRTSVQALLDAATAIRNGAPPVARDKLKIMAGPSVPLASAMIASAIKWSGGGSVAVISPSLSGNFVREAVQRVQAGPCGKNKDIGPYRIRWEVSERDELAQYSAKLQLPQVCTISVAVEVLKAMPRSGPVQLTMDWLKRSMNLTGRSETTADEVMERLKKYVSLRRHHVNHSAVGLLAMTVHQAKNREFDGVIVMWPYTVKGDDEAKRRLLYNAITRARRWCTVIVQSKEMLGKSPFA